MQRPFLSTYLKLAFSVPPILVYILLVYIASHSTDDATAIGIVRHIVLAAGLIPLCAWLVAIHLAKKATVAKLLAGAIGITVLHWAVLAVSSHHDGLLYWSFQAIEIGALFQLIRVSSRQPRCSEPT